MHINFPYLANYIIWIASRKALKITPYIGCLLEWRRFTDRTTNALLNAAQERYKQIITESDAQQCQAQRDRDMQRLIKEWYHNTAETKMPNNFGTDYYFTRFKSHRSCNTSILLITCLPFAHCSLPVPKHNPEYVIFHQGDSFFLRPSPDLPDLILLIMYCKQKEISLGQKHAMYYP